MNIFLVPASRENIRATVEGSVPIEIARRYLRPTEFERLNQVLGPRDRFNCWAMTEGKRSTFVQMRPGDLVVMTLRNTGHFSYVAEILYTLESIELGNFLW